MTLDPAARDGHLAPLDGLRALAIGLVLLYHLTPGHDSNLGAQAILFKLADLGWSGVDLFFVLSGFLITRKLIEARSEAAPFRNFYLRRALRIFPLYYVVLLAAFVLLPAVLPGLPRSPLSEQAPLWLYYSNFRLPQLGAGELLYFGHFWSLAVEEQFYLVWPLVVLRGAASRALTVCVAVLSLAPLARLAAVVGGGEWYVTYQWTPMRADGLVVGALIALLWHRPAARSALQRWSPRFLAAIGPLLFWVAWTDRAGLVFKTQPSLEIDAARVLMPTLLALLFGALLVLSLEWRPLGKLLSAAALRPVARYSYGIYVFHFMLIPYLDRWLPSAWLASKLNSANLAAFIYFLAGSAVSFAAAAASFHFFEARFLAMKPKRAAQPHEVAGRLQ